MFPQENRADPSGRDRGDVSADRGRRDPGLGLPSGLRGRGGGGMGSRGRALAATAAMAVRGGTVLNFLGVFTKASSGWRVGVPCPFLRFYSTL